MKLGLLSAILAGKSFRQAVDLCAQIGFESMETACWPKQAATRRYAGVTHLDVDALTAEQLTQELDYARKKNVPVCALAYYPNPLSADESERTLAIRHIYRLIDVAAETGVGLVNTFIGRDRFKTVEENLEFYEQVWEPIVKKAEEKQVRIAIENCPMLFSKDEWPGGNNLASTPAIWDEMFRRIDSDCLGLNYDPSHCVILDMDYIQPLYTYADKIFHVHLKDTHVFRDKLNAVGRMAYPLDFMSPKLPGLGDIDWARFCSALYDIHFAGSACVELEDRNFEEDDDAIRRGIALAYRNVSRFIPTGTGA